MELTKINNNEEAINTAESQVSVQLQRPKRILHFSDGIMEEYTDNEFEDDATAVDGNTNELIEANPTSLGPWLWYRTAKAGNTFLSGCDYVGGALASFLGITTPKYQYEIDEFKRIKEENAKLEMEKQSAACWQESRKLNCNEAIIKEMDKPADVRF